MSDSTWRLDSLFEAAVQLTSAAERAAFLDQSCGDDAELRKQVELLLESDGQAGSFLNQRPPEFEATLIPDAAGLNLAAALNAGLSPAFTEDQAVIIGNTGHSVLNALGQTIDVPRVMLRDESMIAGEPIVRPKSAEMPQRDPGSRYQLQGEIARGGMGAILEGRDTDLGRDLAIKVLLDQHKDKPEVVQRFVEEAQIGGQLQHPGIAPIYELGQFADRRPYFSMKLVKGETLSKLLASRAEPSADRGKFLGIFEQVCQTMAYAHSRGVIHRDLKPANIMVGAFGEVQVMDWGLAKVLPAGGIADEKKAHSQQQGQSIIQTLRSKAGSDAPGTFGTHGSDTQMGSVMGTPAYMPPEQALGEIDNMDERADVFGLGAMLCEILTGKPPYVGDDGTQVFRMASRGKLTDCFVRLDACGTDAELIVLTKHCLELEPQDRPRDAGVLAERVTGYLESVETKLRETELERAAQTARADAQAAEAVAEGKRADAESRRAEAERQRAESETRRLDQEQRSARKLRKFLSGLAVVALVAGFACVAAIVANQEATNQAKIATANEIAAKASAEVADRERKTAVEAKKATELALSQVEAEKKKVDASLTKAEQAEKAATAERNRADDVAEVAQQNLYYAQMHLAHQAWRETYGLQKMRKMLTDWLPERKSIDRRGWEWFYLNSLPYQNVRTLTAPGTISPNSIVAWHVASNRLAQGTEDGSIRIWDVDREQPTLVLRGPAPVGSWEAAQWIGWSQDGGRLAGGGNDGTVHVWETVHGEKLYVLQGHKSPVRSVAFSSDSGRVAAWGADGTIKIWDAQTRRLAAEVVHPGGVASGAWSPDDQRFAAGHWDGSVSISGAQSGEKIVTLHGHNGEVLGLSWSPDSTRIASASYDFTARIWNIASGQIDGSPLQHSHRVYAVAWEPDGQRLATGSMDNTVKVWDTSTGHHAATLHGHPSSIKSLSWGPGGRLAVGGFHDGRTTIWSSIRDQESSVLSGHVKQVTSASWSPNGKQLASGGFDGMLRIWDATKRELVGKIDPKFGLIRALAWSPDSRQLALAGWDGPVKLKVCDVETGLESLEMPQGSSIIHSLAWSPRGPHLAAGNQDGTIRVIEGLHEDQKVHLIQAHKGRVMAVEWSPQGDRLASAGDDGQLAIWEPMRGTELVRIPAHPGWARSVAWSPDGKQVTSSSDDGLIINWDAASGQKLATMRGHNSYVVGVAFSPDGTRLASAGLDNSVRIWDPRTGEETLALNGNAGFFHSVSWHCDGAKLAAACSDGQIWIWDATRGFERDTTPRALPYIDRKVASGTARGDDARWYAESCIRAGKIKDALAVLHDDPYGLCKIARQIDQQGNAPLADEACTKARTLLEKQRQAEPDNEAAVSELADLLLIGSAGRWTVLKPLEMKSKGGAALAPQSDGSILASGINAGGDIYTVSAVVNLDRVAAVRLEALPDPSLPNKGPGRHTSGNFQLSALRLYYRTTDGGNGLIPLPLASAWASFDYKAHDADVAGLVDEQLNKVWHVWLRFGEAHEAVCFVKESVGAVRGRTLVIELRHKDIGEGINLGRFRLSVSGDDQEQKRLTAMKIIDPWARLAVAYELVGDHQALDSLLKQHPAAAAGTGDLYAADQDWKRAIAEYSKLITDRTIDSIFLSRRARAHEQIGDWPAATADWQRLSTVDLNGQTLLTEFMDRLLKGGHWQLAAAEWRRVVALRPDQMQSAFDEFKKANRWNEAAEFGLQLVQQKPDDTMVWLAIAPVLVLAEEPTVYSEFTGRIVLHFADSKKPETVERVVKASLLRANSIDLAKLPGDILAKSLDDGSVPDWLPPWGWATRALLACRSGDAESAVKYVTKSEEHQPSEFTRALSLSILAMAHHQLKHPEESRRALEEASQVISRLQPGAGTIPHHDLLIAQILFHEAEALINGKAKP